MTTAMVRIENEVPQRKKLNRLLVLYARIALGIGFLSSVADRFALWGAPGAHGVAWGNWKNFVDYVAVLNFFLPHWAYPILAVVVTIAETSFGVLLLLGIRLRESAAMSAVLLCLFALAMTLALGVKAPLDYSVFAASGGATMLSVCAGERN